MKIELINILITLIGYFGALYTKDIIQSIKKQKIIMRKLTSYNNQIIKDIIKNKDYGSRRFEKKNWKHYNWL